MRGARVLKKVEIQRFINQAPSLREQVLVKVGLFCGTRISEALALKFRDFEDGEYITIKSLKGSRTRTLSLHPQLKNAVTDLKKHYASQGKDVSGDTPIFLSQKVKLGGSQKSLSRQAASELLKKMKEAAKLAGRVTAHSLRKCFVTSLYKLLHNDLVELCAYTGHRSLDSLRAYIQTTGKTNKTTLLDWCTP